MEEPKPLDLEKFLNKRITVHVRNGRKLRGNLTQYDDYMNLLLEDAEEYSGDEIINRYKLIFIKGGNVQAIST
jgi:small nuclear ribonucleoprotein